MSSLTAIRPNPRHLVWLPAALLLAWGVLAASGSLVSPSSHAATADTETSTISGTVLPYVAVTGTCIGAHAGVSMAPTAGATALNAVPCTVAFHTNGATGATLYAEHARTNAGQRTFCLEATPGDCVTANGSFTDVADGSAALTDGQFGIRVTNVSNCTTPTWNAAAATDHYSVPSLAAAGYGDTICFDAVGTLANQAVYTLSFDADPDVSTVAGLYRAAINFTAETV